MSTRTRDPAYAGASGRLRDLRDASRLGRRYLAMVKVDGAYVRVVCDSVGRARHFFYRSGGAVPDTLTDGIRGQLVGYPFAEFAAELEAHTEAATRIVATRGYRLAHIFDCLHDGRRSLLGEPFRARRDALLRMRADIELRAPERSWERLEGRKARDRRSGVFAPQRAEGWRSMPILPVYPLAKLDELWSEQVERDGAEGLVLCAVDAPVGRRRSKLKLKPQRTLDCTVLATDGRLARVAWPGGAFIVSCIGRRLEPGQTVEVVCEGMYEAGAKIPGKSYGSGATPKFARLVRTRPDLA